MKKNIKNYFDTLKNLFDVIVVNASGNEIYQFDQGLEEAINMIISQAACGGKLLFIGNGASASIASHMAVDFWKNAGIKAISFNDPASLTCLSNDYGYKHVFEKPIEVFGEAKDILIAISSSGQSENILRAAVAAKEKGIKIITLSGFDNDNPLTKLGDINFYVTSSEYGFVEVIHTAICHCLIDVIVNSGFEQLKKVESNE